MARGASGLPGSSAALASGRRRQQPELHDHAQVIAHRRVLNDATIVREAEQMHVLDGERLVRRRNAGRKAAFVRPVHRHVGSSHVAIDEDPVDLVAQVAEA